MNQGRIWTVVPPAVGLPLIIGGAAVTALLVHFALLTHTTWFSGYWEGAAKKKVSEISTSTAVSALQAPGFTYTVVD